jgi:restriction system protein
MRWEIPLWAGKNQLLQMFANGISKLAPVALLFFGLLAAASFFFGRFRRRLVDSHSSLESLRQMSWKQFELLVADAYRRQGYEVEFSMGTGPDGGVDLTLRRDGRVSLVQCKRWKTYSVGAPVIREMFGVLTAERADEAIIVTTGEFTSEARSFAEGKPIRLLNGQDLFELVQSVQTNPTNPDVSLAAEVEHVDATPACPEFGKPMVLRTARRGGNAGNQFWGCSAYPNCKGIANLTGPAAS